MVLIWRRLALVAALMAGVRAFAATTNITIRVGETTDVITRTYNGKDRWWKLGDGDMNVASVAFADANPSEPRMSGTHSTEAKFTFTGRKAGTTTWKLYTYTDEGATPGYETAGGKGQWTASGVNQSFSVTVEAAPRVEIAKPTAATGLVYDGTVQTGVAAGEHYTRSGTYAAKDAGAYAATVTPADGYCWPDKTYGAVTLAWSIARRPVTVSVLATNKVVGAEEPVYPTKAEGFVAGDGAAVSWKVWRTNVVLRADGTCGLDEAVGKYDLLVAGTAETANYALAYVGGEQAFEITAAGPSVAEGQGTLVYDPDTKEAVVRPEAFVTEVEIRDLPADATVRVPVTIDRVTGAAEGQIRVIYTPTGVSEPPTYDITDVFTLSGNAAEGVTIALNGAAWIDIETSPGVTERITVEPQLTDADDETVKPLAVADDGVSLGAKTVPGLLYLLKRSETPAHEDLSEGGAVDCRRADTTRTKLTDSMEGGRPDKAFYVIEVTK